MGSQHSAIHSDLFVSDADIAVLTGYRRISDQIKFLTRHQWVFHVSAVGRPVISLSYFEKRMGGGSVASPEVAWSPNVAALRS